MNKSIEHLIETLDIAATFLGISKLKDSRLAGDDLQMAANTLRDLRDTLISIALNRGGIASHTAQDALARVGLCYHFTQDYLSDSHDVSVTGYTCAECQKFSKEKMEPFA